MIEFTFVDGNYVVSVNNTYAGEILQDVDGDYYFWPVPNRDGSFPSWFLRKVVEKLEELNA